ncbi:hypothetical protein J6TS7_20370 [Paenibacillus dendritiformis]|nr:hypothetical protein J6TS7_20370 [Paenibacillus dendritiformis]
MANVPRAKDSESTAAIVFFLFNLLPPISKKFPLHSITLGGSGKFRFSYDLLGYIVVSFIKKESPEGLS